MDRQQDRDGTAQDGQTGSRLDKVLYAGFLAALMALALVS